MSKTGNFTGDNGHIATAGRLLCDLRNGGQKDKFTQ